MKSPAFATTDRVKLFDFVRSNIKKLFIYSLKFCLKDYVTKDYKGSVVTYTPYSAQQNYGKVTQTFD